MRELITIQEKFHRAEELLEQFCTVFHEIEGDTGTPIDPRIDKIWRRVTEYFQGVAFSEKEEKEFDERDRREEIELGIAPQDP